MKCTNQEQSPRSAQKLLRLPRKSRADSDKGAKPIVDGPPRQTKQLRRLLDEHALSVFHVTPPGSYDSREHVERHVKSGRKTSFFRYLPVFAREPCSRRVAATQEISSNGRRRRHKAHAQIRAICV